MGIDSEAAAGPAKAAGAYAPLAPFWVPADALLATGVDAEGGLADALGAVEAGGETIAPLGPLMNSMVTTIYGGANEIQRNILARQVLGLPS